MANLKLIRLGPKDNLSTWAEKTNSIINVVENFMLSSGSIVSQGSPNSSQMIVWDSTNSQYTNKDLIGPITIGNSTSTTFSFAVQPSFITDLTEKTIATGNDYVMIYDDSGSALKKAKISAIQTSQAAAGNDTQVQYNQGGVFGASSGLTFNYTTNTLSISNALVVGTTKLVVSGTNVGIGTSTPSYPLDVAGSVNLSSGNTYRIGGNTVLSSTALGSSVVSSSLQSVGTLSSLTVSGTTNLQGSTTVSNTLIANSFSSSGTVSGNILQATTSLSSPLITADTLNISNGISIGTQTNLNPTYFSAFSSNNTNDDGSYIFNFYRIITGGITANKILGKFVFYGLDSSGSTYQAGVVINGVAEGTFSTTSSPASLRFYTTPSGTVSPLERLRIFPSGSITIGASSSTERGLLYVQGTINAGDTQVTSSSVAINISGSGNRSSSIAFHSDATYNPSFSITRAATGANATTTILHRGTGNMIFSNNETAPFLFQIGGTTRLTISSTDLTSTVPISATSGGTIGNTLISGNFLEVSNYGSGDRLSYIDFHSESVTYTDFNFRVARLAGANGNAEIRQRGSGYLDLICQDAGSQIRLYTANTLRVLIDNTGITNVYGELRVT